jgi:alkylation response protein AidB-like acyl-CoA dehydrogenase
MNTIMQHGDDTQKNLYMPPLVEGRWTGTMCLTEPQCGTDLGRSRPRPSRRPTAASHHRHQDLHLRR